MGCVYMATNRKTGMSYIGITTRKFRKRKIDHIAEAKAGRDNYFCQALRDYGAISFQWKILLNSNDPDELAEKEKELIAEHNTLHPNGYNTLKGGWDPPSRKKENDNTIFPE